MWQNFEIQSTATPLAQDRILAVVAIDCTYSRTGSSRHLFRVLSWCPTTAPGICCICSWRGSEEQHMYFMFIHVFIWICWVLLVKIIGTNNRLFWILPYPPATELKKLMTEIQSDFRCLGVLEPHCWKTGEPCIVRGSDILWYRGKVVGLGSSALQVS